VEGSCEHGNKMFGNSRVTCVTVGASRRAQICEVSLGLVTVGRLVAGERSALTVSPDPTKSVSGFLVVAAGYI
jgi:hypothetical protein